MRDHHVEVGEEPARELVECGALRERAAAEQTKFEFENADVPALREIRVTLARRCAVEKPYEKAVKECED